MIRTLDWGCKSPILAALFLLALKGFILMTEAAKSNLNVSKSLVNSICEQRTEFTNSGLLQSPLKNRPPGQLPCGWYGFTCDDSSNRCTYNNYQKCSLLVDEAEHEVVSGRIIGGQPAVPNSFPFVISLQYDTMVNSIDGSFIVRDHVCGGTILTKSWIMTAAHCYDQYGETYYVVAGEHQLYKEEGHEQNRKVAKIFLHNRYSSRYDIALLKLESPLQFNDKVSAAKLPRDLMEEVQGGVTVIGWGMLKDGHSTKILQQVNLPVLSDEKCREYYKEDGKVMDSDFCTLEPGGGKGHCFGDSGSPAILPDNKTVVGIVTWGEGCSRPDGPGVYTQVSYYLYWMQAIMRDDYPY